MRRVLGPIGCCLGLTALVCAAASAGARASVRHADLTLSNEHTFTRGAHVAFAQPIYRQIGGTRSAERVNRT